LASIGSELIGPFTGVFNLTGSLTYSARADTTSRADFDSKFQELMNELYREPDLPTYLTNVTSCTFYLANVTADNPEIVSRNRTWAKTITLDINATAKK
jgi:hypothetical protein